MDRRSGGYGQPSPKSIPTISDRVLGRTRGVADRGVVAKFRALLDTGESEAIALAKEIDADLIILDDADARDTAIEEGLDVVGLLAFLVLAKEEGIINQVRPLLDALRQQGFFISDDLYHHILRRAGES